MKQDVILVISPFALLNCPMVGPSVLLPQLRRRGISAKVYYANLTLASEIGTTVYDRFTDVETPRGGVLGEALFHRWTRDGNADSDYVATMMDSFLDDWERRAPVVGAWAVNPGPQQLRNEVDICLEAIPIFLDRACAYILSHSPRVVGFSLSYPQLAAPIALARRLKAEVPDLTIVAGGPHATSPMGDAIKEACGAFDFVFSGEADFAFPDFVERFLKTGSLPGTPLIECSPVQNLDDVSVPDYDDYFEQLRVEFPIAMNNGDLVHAMLFEASRGCWWGMNNPCTFCGLDSPPKPVATKSPERVFDEIHFLTKRYGIRSLHGADVAFPKNYVKTLFPKLAAESDGKLDLHLNVRADLRADDLNTMKRAGVTGLLCGIESFSSPLLRMLNKGVTAHENLCFLRDCRARNIYVDYILLMGIPGEDPEEYRSMISLIPKLEHLQPPRFSWEISLIRDATYFSDPEKYGITGIAPADHYRMIFGNHEDLDRMASIFNATFPSGFLTDDSLREEFTVTVNAWCDNWQQGKRLPILNRIAVVPGVFAVQDTRRCRREEFYFPDEKEFMLLDFLSTPRRRSDLPDAEEGTLDNLLTRHFVVEHEGFLLSLVTDA